MSCSGANHMHVMRAYVAVRSRVWVSPPFLFFFEGGGGCCDCKIIDLSPVI